MERTGKLVLFEKFVKPVYDNTFGLLTRREMQLKKAFIQKGDQPTTLDLFDIILMRKA